jgi:hypothetical protein
VRAAIGSEKSGKEGGVRRKKGEKERNRADFISFSKMINYYKE